MTAFVSLRPLEVADAEEMSMVLADPELYEFTGGAPPDRSDLERRYRVHALGHSPDGTELWINQVVVAESEQRAVGYVQATVPVGDGPAEIAWVIGRPWQGRGYATQAASLLLGQLHGLGVVQIIAHIHPHHRASQCVARRLGLQPTEMSEDGETRWIADLA